MGRLFKFIFQIIATLLMVVLIMTAIVLFDGLTDHTQKVDAALVVDASNPSLSGGEQPLVDKVADLFKKDEFHYVFISGPALANPDAEPGKLAKLLEKKGVPADAIVPMGEPVETTDQAARHTLEELKTRDIHSVMVVSDYYHVTGVKIALYHNGVTQIQNAHVGVLQQGDAWPIAHEVVDLFDYMGHAYVLPAAEKLKEEAQAGADKAKIEAEKVKSEADKAKEKADKDAGTPSK